MIRPNDGRAVHDPPQEAPFADVAVVPGNHAREMAAIDFFVVPTARFRLLYCFLVLSHDRRRVLHFNVSQHPTSVWTARRLVEAFPFAAAPRFLLHDRDNIYGNAFQNRVTQIGVEEIVTAPRSPWQNAYVERLVGSIRRECLDHVIVLNEAHLKRILSSYFAYYHESRTHLGLDGNSPDREKLNSHKSVLSARSQTSAACTTATRAKRRHVLQLALPCARPSTARPLRNQGQIRPLFALPTSISPPNARPSSSRCAHLPPPSPVDGVFGRNNPRKFARPRICPFFDQSPGRSRRKCPFRPTCPVESLFAASESEIRTPSVSP